MIPRIAHEVTITEYEDGSHDITCDHYNEDTFVQFSSYLMSAGFAEHWIDKLPNYLVELLRDFQHSVGHSEECTHNDGPVVQPTEVFTEKDEED